MFAWRRDPGDRIFRPRFPARGVSIALLANTADFRRRRRRAQRGQPRARFAQSTARGPCRFPQVLAALGGPIIRAHR